MQRKQWYLILGVAVILLVAVAVITQKQRQAMLSLPLGFSNLCDGSFQRNTIAWRFFPDNTFELKGFDGELRVNVRGTYRIDSLSRLIHCIEMDQVMYLDGDLRAEVRHDSIVSVIDSRGTRFDFVAE